MVKFPRIKRKVANFLLDDKSRINKSSIIKLGLLSGVLVGLQDVNAISCTGSEGLCSSFSHSQCNYVCGNVNPVHFSVSGRSTFDDGWIDNDKTQAAMEITWHAGTVDLRGGNQQLFDDAKNSLAEVRSDQTADIHLSIGAPVGTYDHQNDLQLKRSGENILAIHSNDIYDCSSEGVDVRAVGFDQNSDSDDGTYVHCRGLMGINDDPGVIDRTNNYEHTTVDGWL